MAKFIEGEMVLKKMHALHTVPFFKRHRTDEDVMFDTMVSVVEEHPAADVVEVVHGEWISEFGSYCTPRCSACGWHKPYTGDYYCAKELYSPWNYCPNCGAKMDGKGADNAEQN